MNTRPNFDDIDQRIKSTRVGRWNDRSGPRVGDYARMPDGTLRRFTHDWDHSIQTTSNSFPEDASFYFADNYCSFSGSHGDNIKKTRIKDSGEVKEGRVWFFHHDQHCAHNGVHTTIPCRIYEILPDPAVRRIIATFIPQAWVNDYAVTVDPQGATTFDVTETILRIGEARARALRDDQHETDELRTHAAAPQWVRDWHGPFAVNVEQSIAAYFDATATDHAEPRGDA